LNSTPIAFCSYFLIKFIKKAKELKLLPAAVWCLQLSISQPNQANSCNLFHPCPTEEMTGVFLASK